MPWIEYGEAGKKHGWADHYREPEVQDCDVDALLEHKKTLSRDRDSFLAYQKQCGRSDPALGRFFREVAAQTLKEYRGACYALSKLLCDPPGDCRDVGTSKELAPYIDRAFWFQALDHG